MRIGISEAESDTADTAVVALFQAHQLALVRTALLIVGDRPTAEDVVQDAFVALHERVGAIEDPLPYIRRSVVNRCRSVLRRRRVAGLFRAPPEPPIWSAESAVVLGEERRAVFLAVRTLPARQREALVLRYYLDLNEAEIARTMGVSRGTVKSTISRAVAALGRKLQEES